MGGGEWERTSRRDPRQAEGRPIMPEPEKEYLTVQYSPEDARIIHAGLSLFVCSVIPTDDRDDDAFRMELDSAFLIPIIEQACGNETEGVTTRERLKQAISRMSQELNYLGEFYNETEARFTEEHGKFKLPTTT